MDSSSSFSFKQARSTLKGLGVIRPTVYWLDFSLSIFAGHGLFFAMLASWSLPSVPQFTAMMVTAVLFFPTAVLYMRCAMFIHEIAHQGDKLRAFRIYWNSLCGVPFLIPSFTYLPHADHHRRKSYGTETDGEYLALGHWSRWWIIGFVAQSLVIPFLMYVRFLIVSPMCWLVPGMRRWVHRHASTMLVDPTYERDAASKDVMRLIVRQEVLCFLWMIWFTFSHWAMTGELLSPLWCLGYSISVAVISLNACRTLGAHRWESRGGELTFEDQLLDTLNYPDRSWITELWGPIGTRFHSLHHLFPSLPYHDLPEAHRRLMASLPEDSPYRRTQRVSLLMEIRALWQRASSRESQDEDSLSLASS